MPATTTENTPRATLPVKRSACDGDGWPTGLESPSCRGLMEDVMHEPQLRRGGLGQQERIGIRQSHAAVEIIGEIGEWKPGLDESIEWLVRPAASALECGLVAACGLQ